eukprot:scaffold360_cov334-Prasinococcus_capsulatus_cf.AAC.10
MNTCLQTSRWTTPGGRPTRYASPGGCALVYRDHRAGCSQLGPKSTGSHSILARSEMDGTREGRLEALLVGQRCRTRVLKHDGPYRSAGSALETCWSTVCTRQRSKACSSPTQLMRLRATRRAVEGLEDLSSLDGPRTRQMSPPGRTERASRGLPGGAIACSPIADKRPSAPPSGLTSRVRGRVSIGRGRQTLRHRTANARPPPPKTSFDRAPAAPDPKGTRATRDDRPFVAHLGPWAAAQGARGAEGRWHK